MLRVAGLDIGAFEELEAAAVEFRLARPGVDQASIQSFGERAQEFYVVGSRGIIGQHEQNAAIGAFGCLMEGEGGVVEIALLHVKSGAFQRILNTWKP